MFQALTKYAVFTGRSSRKEFWLFLLMLFIGSFAFGFFDAATGTFDPTYGYGVTSMLFTLAMVIPSISVGVRRLHDTDRSGWWILLSYVPLVNLVYLVFMCLPGSAGENQYGPNPLDGNHSKSIANPIRTETTIVEDETHQLLVKLSGFDQRGLPFSMEVQDSSILRGRGYVIGRSRNFSDFAVDHERISRAHVHFTYGNGSLYVADLNSANGTFLNGIQLRAFSKTRVNPSDELRLADITLAVSR